MTKNCTACPSMLTAEDAQQFFGKATGAPMCATFGYPLAFMGHNDSERATLRDNLAENCEAYGKPRSATPDWNRAKFNVAMGDSRALVKDRTTPEAVTSCRLCEWFVPPNDMIKASILPMGYCGAKGQMIPTNRLTFAARNCDRRSMGPQNPEDIIENLVWLPAYQVGPKNQAQREAEKEAALDTVVDPREYPTDREVNAQEDAKGIRAWRKIEDPESDKFVYLPIYKVEAIPEKYRHLIPQIGDEEHPEDYLDHSGAVYKVAVLWMELDETPAANGPAGVGKTELFRHLAWLMQLPYFRFSITASTELDDLAGKMHFENGETVFKYGRLPEAWTHPSVIVVDEPNTGPLEVWQFLRPLTDNSKQLVLDMNEGEHLPRHRDAFLGMAMNPAWDLRNIGANEIGDADASRLMHLFMDLPPERLERRIIKDRCNHDGWKIEDTHLDLIMKVAEEIRALCEEGAITASWGIRPQLKVARLLRWFEPLTAYRMALADFLSPDQQNTLLEVVRSHIE